MTAMVEHATGALAGLAALAAALAVALAHPPGPARRARSARATAASGGDVGRPRPRAVRGTLAGLAGCSVLLVVPGPAGVVGGPVVAVLAWRALGRAESAAGAAARREAARDLPYLVLLLAAGLRAGSAAGPALGRACAALPGAAADRLRPAVARLEVGVPPPEVWRELAADPVVAPLGGALARSADTGASVVVAVERLATELAADARSDVEDRARTVGVRAALPLGLCLLPAFLLLGIVPLVASLVGGLVGG